MHEYAIVENMVSLVEDEAKKYETGNVTQINLVIGELASVEPEAIKMYFDLLSKDTILEGAKLSFKLIEAEMKCDECGEVFLKSRSIIECPKCGRIGKFTGKGKEFYIESIEVK